MNEGGILQALESENRRLAAELAEAQEILHALRRGEVDALVGSEFDSVYAVQLIALAVDRADTYMDALALLVGRVCETTRGDYCEAWAVTPDQRSLRPAPAWCGTGADAVRLHEAMGIAGVVPPAALLEVFQSGKPRWLTPGEMQARWTEAKRRGGFQCGLAVPLVVDGRTLAVLSLWMLEDRAGDDEILRKATRILEETGRFVQRKLEQESRQELVQSLRGVIRDRSRRVSELTGELDWKDHEREAAEQRARNNQQARILSERALDQQMALLQEVLDGMADGVVITDTVGKVLRFNAAAQQLLGRAPDSIPIERWPQAFGLYHTRDGTQLSVAESPLMRAVRGERTGLLEIFLRNKTCPRGRLLQVSANPVRSTTSALSFGAFMLIHEVAEAAHAG